MEVRHGGVDYLTDCPPEVYGRVIDFSVNINPLGLPEACVKAILRELHGELRGTGCAGAFSKYPDPFCHRLRAALAEYLSVPADRIVCGNGAGDLIYRIVHMEKPARAMITSPAFLDYEKSLREISCEIVHHELSKESFKLDEQILSKIDAGVQIMFLGNPDNPAGHTIEPELLAQIIRKCDERGVTLVIDECFNEFLDSPSYNTALPHLAESAHLVILRAFTKTYAMAGLRLGYCLMGSVEKAKKLSLIGQAWPVSVPAQIAGIAALGESEYLYASRALIQKERARMKDEMTRCGLDILGGEANFIFFRISLASDFDNNTFFDSLFRHNILLRRCDNYRGLDDSYYRAAVLGHDENRLLLRALAEIKREKGGTIG